jgi:ABC-2 type transport system ATP-binding protein
MRISDAIEFFQDFYEDFDQKKCSDMLDRLHLDPKKRLKTLSKGTKEKVQLILVMSRKADLYFWMNRSAELTLLPGIISLTRS